MSCKPPSPAECLRISIDNAIGAAEDMLLEQSSTDRMLEWFKFGHLPPHLQETSKVFCAAALAVVATICPGPERTVALRKLLEAKDAAVRAVVVAGG